MARNLRDQRIICRTVDDIRERSAIVTESGCWVWLSRTNGQYGMARSDAGLHMAHRLSYELAHGPIPPGLVVCHKCDVKICVNPGHLFVGTYRDNSQDMVRKERQARGGRMKHTRLSEDQVVAIRHDRRPSRQIAREYSVTKNAIDKIRARVSWRWLPDEPPREAA